MRPNWLVTGQQLPSLLDRLIARQKMFHDKGNGIMEWLERVGRVQAARTRHRVNHSHQLVDCEEDGSLGAARCCRCARVKSVNANA